MGFEIHSFMTVTLMRDAGAGRRSHIRLRICFGYSAAQK
jgi:hypothetical protein